MFRKTLLVSIAALLAAPALADTRMQYVDEKSGAARTAIIIKDGKVRMNHSDSKSWSLYDAKTDTLTTVNPGDRSYAVLDEETMNKVSGQMSAAMQEMKKQLEQMPPEQRAMMEKMMGGMKDAGKGMMETKIDRTGKTLDKAGYDCKQVFMSVGSLSRSELCVVDIDELDIPSADRKTLDAMQKRMKAFAESMSDAFGADFKMDFDSLGGMPVYMKQDKERSGELLKEVGHSGIDAALFRIPEGYKQEKIEVGE